MSRQSEFKVKFDPIEYKFTKQYIWGGGKMSNIFSKIFGTTFKKATKKAAEKAVVSASRKAGEQAGKKAGDKIVQMLSKDKGVKPPRNPPVKKVTFNIPGGVAPPRNPPAKVNTILKNTIPPSTQQQINQRVNAIISGGSMRKII